MVFPYLFVGFTLGSKCTSYFNVKKTQRRPEDINIYVHEDSVTVFISADKALLQKELFSL